MKKAFILLVIVGYSILGFSQTPNGIVNINENGYIMGNLPLNTSFTLKGVFPTDMNKVIVDINNQPLVAKQVSEGVKEYEIYVNKNIGIKSSNTVIITFSNTNANTEGVNELSEADPINTNTVDAKVTSSRYAPIAGIGLAFLGTSPKSEVDMFGHVGFKFYLTKNVDKRNQNDPEMKTYPRLRDHFGIILAGGMSTLAYRGKALDKPVFNFYPMLGVSYDFMPELSVDAGAIFFDYNKIDSSIQSSLDAKLKMGFFMTVSLDFDLFTKFKDLTNSK